MNLAVDVHYGEAECVAAGVLFARFEDAAPGEEVRLVLPPAEAYESGQFYLRELPPLLALLATLAAPPERVVVDGYVYLGVSRRPGLGFRLWEASGVPVIGVAKTAFAGTPAECQVVRGGARPLFVTAVGLELEEAKRCIAAMHGPFRLPTLLKRVDRLARLR